MNDFIGRGLAFPMRLAPDGSVALVSGETEIIESIRLILGTPLGDRPMRPEFGCAIHDMVFRPADASLQGAMAYEVSLSLARWEPRIDVVQVRVDVDAADTSCVYITVVWSLREANDPRNLVFPFYMIPGE